MPTLTLRFPFHVPPSPLFGDSGGGVGTLGVLSVLVIPPACVCECCAWVGFGTLGVLLVSVTSPRVRVLPRLCFRCGHLRRAFPCAPRFGVVPVRGSHPDDVENCLGVDPRTTRNRVFVTVFLFGIRAFRLRVSDDRKPDRGLIFLGASPSVALRHPLSS